MMNKNVMTNIFSYIVNYPILKFWGREIAKPIALVFENRAELTDALKFFENQCVFIEPEDSVKRVRKVLHRANSRGVFFVADERARERKVFDILLDAGSYGYDSGSPLSTAVVLLFIGMIPVELKERVYEIHFSLSNFKFEAFQLEDFAPSPQKLELVRDLIYRDANNMKNSIIPATAFVYASRFGEKYAECLEVAEKMDAMAEEFLCQEGVVEVFCDKLYGFIGDGEVDGVYKLPYVAEDGLKNIQNAIYFDEKFLYVHSKYFQTMCSSFFGNGMSSVVIKSALLENGIIVADGTSGYTTKMPYIRPSGKFERVRMMKFDLKKIQGATREDLLNYLLEVM